MTVHLHIGLPKTGTTATQSFLARHRERLTPHGALYPLTLGQAAHTALVIYAAGHDTHFRRQRMPQFLEAAAYEEWRRRLRRRFQAELAATPSRDLVLSSEHLYASLESPAQIQRVRELTELHSEARVIVYLRRQDSYALSSFGEAVRMGYPGSFDEFLRRPTTRHALAFEARLDAWAEVFGAAAVTVRVFEPARMKEGNQVADFLELVGLKALADELPEEVARREREGLSAAALDFLQQFNRATDIAIQGDRALAQHLRTGRIRERLAVLLAGVGQGRLSLATERRRAILAEHAEANARLFQRFGVEGFDEEMPPEPPPHAPLDHAELAAFAARIWVAGERDALAHAAA